MGKPINQLMYWGYTKKRSWGAAGRLSHAFYGKTGRLLVRLHRPMVYWGLALPAGNQTWLAGNPPFSSMIFPLIKPLFIGDFPASHHS